ncbi:MAG: hypothetical protein DRR06_19920 [Gammaproteobacteria bacterium]|nr:MAG: hypothetical protein DRR06_19920 [Gammaproteobacteria bacterium]
MGKVKKIKVPKTPKRKMTEMNNSHIEIISEMIESQSEKTNGLVNNGIKDRQGRGAHEFRINGIPYWIIMAG